MGCAAIGPPLVPLAFGPCRYDGALTFHLSGIGAPRWGGATLWRDRGESQGLRGAVPGGTLEVAFSTEGPTTALRFEQPPVEVFRGTERVSTPWRRIEAGRADGACGFSHVASFDLRALPPGTYTLVHRRARGLGGGVHCGRERCAWGTYAGEDALVTALTLPGPEASTELEASALDPNAQVRFGRAAECYDRALLAGAALHEVELSLELRARPDRAYGVAELASLAPSSGQPEVPEASALYGCVREAFGAPLWLDARPRGAWSARYQVVVARSGQRVKVSGTLVGLAPLDAPTHP